MPYDPTEECDCITEGSVAWQPGEYFNTRGYIEQNRDVKLAELWSQLTETDRGTSTVSPTKPKCQNFGEVWKHFAGVSFLSFLSDGD